MSDETKPAEAETEMPKLETRIAKPGTVFDLGETLRCPKCDAPNTYGTPYLAAHWSEGFVYTCPCGHKVSFRAGRISWPRRHK